MPQIHFSEPLIVPHNPWADDCLNRKFFADHLSQIVAKQANPCVIAINGEWGSGKTFMLKRWQCDLEKNEQASLYFNAWESDSIEHAALALIGELYRFLIRINDDSFKRQVALLRESCAKLLKLSNIPRAISAKIEDKSGINVLSDTTHCLEDYAKAIEQRKVLQETIGDVANIIYEQHGNPLVFIIDELDRCRPIFAIELLETVKHIFNVPHCIFILGIDKKQLQHSLRAVYGEIDSQKYLERFFDFEMRLSCPEVKTYFTYLYDTHIPKGKDCPSYLVPDDKSGIFRNSLLCVCEYYNLNLREIEIVFKTFFAVFNFQEIQQCRYPILLAVMVVIRLREQAKYMSFVHSLCNPKDVIDLPYVKNSCMNECAGLIMATIYGSYMNTDGKSPFEDEIKKLLKSNLWDRDNPNAGSVPENIIPRFVHEALAYRKEVLSNNNLHQHYFNPSCYFSRPIDECRTPDMRDKIEIAKFLDMID